MEKEGKDIGRVVPWSYVIPFYEGFWELSSDRTTSGFGGMSGVPYTSKVAWLQINTDPSLWDLGLYCFQVIDAEYMSYQHARMEADRKKNKRK